MSTALKSVFDSHVVANILAFVPVDDYQIETLYGFTHIYGGKHYITYGEGPEGASCISSASGAEGEGGTGGTGIGSQKRFIPRLKQGRLPSSSTTTGPNK